MNKGIVEYNDKRKIIYTKTSNYETWYTYDDRSNLVYLRQLNLLHKTYYEEWREFSENNREIYYRDTRYFLEGSWYKYDENGKFIKEITEKEFKEIKRKEEEKEFLSRKYCSRFEIMDM
jgi:hypothetical protein